MPPLKRLAHVLLASAVAVQVASPAWADAKPYIRLQATGGAGLGSGGGAAAGTTTTSDPGNVVTSNPVTPGNITVTQTNTDGSTTTTTTTPSGVVTTATTDPSGTVTTVTTTPSATTGGNPTVSQTVTPAGGTSKTTAVTPGAISGANVLTVHVDQPLTAQFATTSTGTPAWTIVGADAANAPSTTTTSGTATKAAVTRAAVTTPTMSGAASAIAALLQGALKGTVLDHAAGSLSGRYSTVGSYPILVSDGLNATPYPVTIVVVPPLDIADAKLSLRVGTPAQGRYAPLNVILNPRETTPSLPTSVVLASDGTVFGTPAASDPIPAIVAVTLHDTITTDPATGYVTKTFSVTYYPQPLTVADYPDLTVTAGKPVSVPAPAVGGSPVNPVFTHQGNLPGGLTLDRATGAISGTPTSVPTTSQIVTVTVTDDTGASATTDPFHVGPAVTGTGVASTEYPVLAEDVYCELSNSFCPIPYETYFTRAGAAPRGMFLGVKYTYAHPVVTDGTIDVATSDGNTDYALWYNASTNGGQDWEPVTGTVVATQFRLGPSSSNNDTSGARVPSRLRIGNAGAFPGWEPYLTAGASIPPMANAPASYDLSKLMPSTDGTAPLTYLVSGLPQGMTFDGQHTISGTPTAAVNVNATVRVADVAGLPSLPQTLAVHVQSTVTADTVYPTAEYQTGDPTRPYPVGQFYSNDMRYSPLTDVVEVQYGQPVRSDGSIDEVRDDKTSTFSLEYFNGQLINGYGGAYDDWEPVVGSATSTRFRIRYSAGYYAYRARVGNAGNFPPFLPHVLDARAAATQPGQRSTVDLSKVMPPVDGKGPFTYTVVSSSDRMDGYGGYTTPRTVPGLSNVPGVTFDGTRTLSLDGTTPQGTYGLRVTVSDANGFQSVPSWLYLDVQSAVLASAAYPTTIQKRCCYGPDIPTGTAYSENVTRERDDGAYGWNVTFAQPTQLDGSIDYLGDDSAPTIWYQQPFVDQWNWVDSTWVQVTGPATATSLWVRPQHDGDGAAHMRFGDGGLFPDWLPSVSATSHTYLPGGSLAIPVGKAMSVIDAKGATTFSVQDNTSIPTGTSFDGSTVTGSIISAGTSATDFAVSDSRGFTSRAQTLTLTGTSPSDPTLGGAYAIADYRDASVRAGKAVGVPAPTLTGPWVAPRLTLQGTLPAGLTFNADGSITGTPTSDLTAPVALAVTATDAYGYNTTTDVFHLVPYGYVAITNGTLNATFMEAAPNSLAVALNAIGGTDGATWKVTSGAMPPGLALNVAAGTLDGAPTAMTAATQLGIQVTSASGNVSTANLTLQVTMRSTVFDGSSNYVTLPDVATTFGGGSTFTGYTAAAWVNFSNGGCWERIFEFASGPNGQDSQAFGRPYCGFNGLYGADYGGNLFTSDGLVPQGTWAYVAEVQSGTAMTIYVDGVAQATGAEGIPAVVARPMSWLGRSSFGNDGLFAGQMADFQFYDRPLSTAELATTQAGSSTTGLVARYLTGHSQRADLSGVAGPAAPSGAFATAPFTPPNVGGHVTTAATVSGSGMCDFVASGQGATVGGHSQYPCTETIQDLLKANQLDPTATNAIYGYYDLTDVSVGDVVGPDKPKILGAFVNPRITIFPALPSGLTFGADGTISGRLLSPEAETTVHVVTISDDRGVSAKTEVAMSYKGVAQFADAVRSYNFDTSGIDEMASDVLSAGSLPSGTTWQVSTGSLPPGLKMDATGHLTGGVVHVGSYPVTLTATSNGAVIGSGTIKYFVSYVAGTFDGGSYLTLPSGTTSNFFDANGNFTGYTVAEWVNFADVRAWERVWDFAAGGSGNDDMYLARSGGDTVFRNQPTSGGGFTGGSIVPGTWTHVTTTMTPSGLMTLYQDGQVVAQGQEGIPDNVDRPMSFLGRSTYPDPLFAGQIADVQIYGNPISQSQVQSIMQGDRGTGIKGWYMIGIYPGYDASKDFSTGGNAATVSGNIGQAQFMPPYAPGN